jgi:hypothetical protein
MLYSLFCKLSIVVQKELLENLVKQNKSTYQIANDLNCSQTNVRHWLKKFNLVTNKLKQTSNQRSKSQIECQRDRAIRRKLEYIKKLGGCCKMCGYNKNWSALEFHHRNPEDKVMQLSLERLGHVAENKILVEVVKCDLLCANCHREFHNPDKQLVGVEGNAPSSIN